MAVRKRFTPAEREAYTPGTAVLWLDGSHWKAGVIADGAAIETNDGWQEIKVVNEAPTTRTISRGQVVTPGAGHLRLPQ